MKKQHFLHSWYMSTKIQINAMKPMIHASFIYALVEFLSIFFLVCCKQSLKCKMWNVKTWWLCILKLWSTSNNHVSFLVKYNCLFHSQQAHTCSWNQSQQKLNHKKKISRNPTWFTWQQEKAISGHTLLSSKREFCKQRWQTVCLPKKYKVFREIYVFFSQWLQKSKHKSGSFEVWFQYWSVPSPNSVKNQERKEKKRKGEKKNTWKSLKLSFFFFFTLLPFYEKD